MSNQPEFKPYISVVIPVYACADCLTLLFNRLVKALSGISENFEIIMINDRSPDGAWSRIEELAAEDVRVKGINLSRNFGQHSAITAGLDFASGEWVVVMDCDLQDQPEEIPKLHAKALEGYDVVFGRREQRKDDLSKKLYARAYRKVFSFLTDQVVDPSTANFSIVSHKVAAAFRHLREQNRSYATFVRWLGYNSTSVAIEHAARPIGTTSYSFRRLTYLAFDLIISHSNKPLRLSIGFGFLMSIVSFIVGLALVGRYLIFNIPVAGWTSVIVSIYLIGGLLFANLGVLGLYIGKTFNELKGRPLYLIDTVVNIERVGTTGPSEDYFNR